MPSPRHTRFRLLANLPLEVDFKNIAYTLEIVLVPVSGMWQLKASYSGGYWLCAYRATEEALQKAIYEEGLGFAGTTITKVIFERLVKDGRAEMVG